ncbi:MAG: serine O-acetyltransferase EpsC [Nitrosomonas sp.]|nr:serine O-acetyltransferase EpsC [Nitrosomonas sp.]MDO8894536.1 serine O-acetyltransferase EpsC [Nitrosomonas sp.]MDO9470227.1 serine O-acetyltransferase EpsC [Nitrosomonas sp.]MDP1786154.1 serine O-acetyltransferase EpsC [Nitrosomonas sp.]MDP1934109.1 serine O-acetyltransferase EpsC [Nitrosomonas sp.]MDP2224637.1 serine O-acetyltransferase EpsC [Nitrosomonas sp.]
MASLQSRNRGHDKPPKLPSRKILMGVAEGLSAALFPNRLGSSEFADEGIDYYVGHTLNMTLRELMVQIQHELHYNSGLEILSNEDREQSVAITQAFAKRLPEVRSLLESDIIAAYEGDPAARNVDEVLVCYPGIMAITHYRLAHVLHGLGAPLIARMFSEIAHSVTGIEIHPGAQIGGRFFIDHGTGVVIGETAIIGQNVRLYQAVTLGAKRFPVDENGALVKGNLRHPIVEDDVVIYAGATILGRITIGRGSTIGGNVWLTRSVPPGSNISQAQMRQEVFEGGAGI